MRRSVLLALSTAALACGAPPKPVEQAPSAASVARASPTPEVRCAASIVKQRPAEGWHETGTIVVSLDGGRPTAIEARDARGELLERVSAPPNRAEAQRWMERATCRAGAMIAALDGEPPKDGVAKLALLAPDAPSEQADLARLCAAPDELPPSRDDAQKLRLAIELHEEALTTARWRAWLRDLLEETRARDGASEPARRARARELEAATPKRSGACWLADALRR